MGLSCHTFSANAAFSLLPDKYRVCAADITNLLGPCWRTEVMKMEAKPIRCNAFVLSDYVENLPAYVKSRYIQKISDIQIDPLLMPANKLSEECLPPVECIDLEVSF